MPRAGVELQVELLEGLQGASVQCEPLNLDFILRKGSSTSQNGASEHVGLSYRRIKFYLFGG